MPGGRVGGSDVSPDGGGDEVRSPLDDMRHLHILLKLRYWVKIIIIMLGSARYTWRVPLSYNEKFYSICKIINSNIITSGKTYQDAFIVYYILNITIYPRHFISQ